MVAKVLRDSGRPLSFGEVAERIGRDVGSVAKAALWLKSKGLVEVEEKVRRRASLGDEGREYASEGLPERRLVNLLKSRGGEAPLNEAKAALGDRFQIGLMWAKRNGWIEIARGEDGPVIRLREEPGETLEEHALRVLADGPRYLEELPGELREACLRLAQRPGVVVIEEEREHILRPARALMELPREELEAEEVTRLTRELLASGRWRKVRFSRFDVRAPTPPSFTAKRHPLQQLIKLVREAFIEMGFEEIRGPMVELAFWNFDALFQPQDHPARDMHDTFYLKEPSTGDLPERFVEPVRRAHEDGGGTGSIGWRYAWSREEASKLILRTHTTATTIRYLAEHPEPPVKVFSVDRIFRNERVDWKHLAEFHQIEGIVMDEGVCFRDLLGLIKEFYSRLGLREVRFRPSYFPYTEPSAEAIVYLKDKGVWLELIGMGIFRPEVTLPLGVKHRVLAWGGGLERLALALFDLDDIRAFYINDLRWIRGTPNLLLERKTGKV